MKNKNIELKDITSSPFFIIGLYVFLCIAVVVGMVFAILDISETKQEIVDARKLYEENIKQVALLEELKVKSEAAEEQLEACKNILPDSLGDVYILEEDVLAKCEQFGLNVSSIAQTVAVNETQEIVFTITASAPYENIYNYMNYYTNLEQVHRFDSLSLSEGSDGEYNATFSLAFLAEQGAEGGIGAVVDAAVSEVAAAATTAAAS